MSRPWVTEELVTETIEYDSLEEAKAVRDLINKHKDAGAGDISFEDRAKYLKVMSAFPVSYLEREAYIEKEETTTLKIY